MSGERNYSFFVDLNDSFFTQPGNYFSPQQIKANALIPFKDHPQLSTIVDVLSRKNKHHLVLQNEFPLKFYPSFFEALLLHLNHEHIPHPLNGAELIYMDLENLIFTPTMQKSIEKDFEILCNALDSTNKYLLFAFNNLNFLCPEYKKPEAAFFFLQLKKLMLHPKCRFLIFTSAKTSQPFDQLITLDLAPPNEADIITMLKLQRTELENFHHVLIPEELLTLAYSLAERYLSTSDTLQKALLLLDSSAARTSSIESSEHNNQFKPVMTLAVMTAVLSSWTQIPASHLLLNKFKLNDFMQGMQQRVFGQDTAITILGHEIQQAQARLQQNHSPFCSLLFAGPEHTGKKTAALALTEQLFKQMNVIYSAQLMSSPLVDMKLQRCFDKRYFQLKEAVTQTPYAIFMFENIDQAAPALLEELQEILSTGYLHDTNGSQYSFRQAIIILCTTLGTKRLLALEQMFTPEHEHHDIDLMQLVMNEQKHEVLASAHHYSPRELADEILLDIGTQLPTGICQYTHVVPFLRLDKTAIEKIIHLKLNLLGKMLHSRYSVELAYAPEVIHYLANEVLRKQEIENPTTDIDKTLKQLYFVVEQAIFNQADNKHRPSQLFLQLNETGQLLRCDWLVVSTVRHHSA